jgi:hypothetical protein
MRAQARRYNLRPRANPSALIYLLYFRQPYLLSLVLRFHHSCSPIPYVHTSVKKTSFQAAQDS